MGIGNGGWGNGGGAMGNGALGIGYMNREMRKGRGNNFDWSIKNNCSAFFRKQSIYHNYKTI